MWYPGRIRKKPKYHVPILVAIAMIATVNDEYDMGVGE